MRESRRGFVFRGYLESFWRLCRRLDLVVVGQAATGLAMGKPLRAHGCFQKREGGGFFFLFFFSQGLPFLLLAPSIFPVRYCNSLCGSPASPLPRRHLYKSSSFNILTITPSSLSLLTPLCPHFSYPSLFPSVSTMVRSHGGRQLAGCRLAAMATGTLPLPQVSLATSSLAL